MFELIDSSVKYQNKWLSVREDHVHRPDGIPGIFGIVTMQPGSTVVAIDGSNNVLLSREYKYALKRESLELISGGMDTQESPLSCAQRELEEEAGVRADRWTDLGRLDPFTTVIDSPNYMFLAEELHENGEQNLDSGEVLEIVRMPLAAAVGAVMNSEITHGASCAAILKAWILRNGKGS